ncbi:MAG: SPFH domain-containing protein [Patescibacteria group bacterium]|nr:SPFH domain-containing protein [Patescibacteria group bacterium]
MIRGIIFGLMEIIPIIIFGLMVIGMPWLVFVDIWGCVPLGLGGLGLVLCLKKIPAEPPSLGVITFWGERKKKVKKEGWRFLAPFFPFLYDVIIVDVTKKNKDMPAETVTVRTPDLAVLEIPTSLTWTPHKDHLIEYLNCGGEEGVNNILVDIVRERIRGWAMNHQEGPQTFKQALGAREDATNILIKAIAGTELERVPSRIPTNILFKYFNEPQIPPTKSEEKKWSKEWERVKNILKGENKEKIKEAVNKRREQIKEIQRGNGVQVIPQLGITLNRLNIGDIAIQKGSLLWEASEKEVKEEREEKAETKELKHVGLRISELMSPPWNYTRQEARDIVQTERSKVNKQIYDVQGLEGLGQGIGAILKRR